MKRESNNFEASSAQVWVKQISLESCTEHLQYSVQTPVTCEKKTFVTSSTYLLIGLNSLPVTFAIFFQDATNWLSNNKLTLL